MRISTKKKKRSERTCHDEPVVDHEVGDEVVFADGRNASVVTSERGEQSSHGEKARIREENLPTVASVEDERAGIKVLDCGERSSANSFTSEDGAKTSVRFVPLGYHACPEALLKR
jgi:hypothetical protein